MIEYPKRRQKYLYGINLANHALKIIGYQGSIGIKALESNSPQPLYFSTFTLSLLKKNKPKETNFLQNLTLLY